MKPTKNTIKSLRKLGVPMSSLGSIIAMTKNMSHEDMQHIVDVAGEVGLEKALNPKNLSKEDITKLSSLSKEIGLESFDTNENQ